MRFHAKTDHFPFLIFHWSFPEADFVVLRDISWIVSLAEGVERSTKSHERDEVFRKWPNEK
jgi:hypothetical protein